MALGKLADSKRKAIEFLLFFLGRDRSVARVRARFGREQPVYVLRNRAAKIHCFVGVKPAPYHRFTIMTSFGAMQVPMATGEPTPVGLDRSEAGQGGLQDGRVSANSTLQARRTK